MKKILLSCALIPALCVPALAGGNGQGGNQGGNSQGGNRAAPAPIIHVGLGLPVLAVCFGIYWLVNRRRRQGFMS
jgi:hypothetical protein